MDTLVSLGFSEAFREALPEGAVPARVASERRGRYLLWHEHGECPGQLAGRLLHEGGVLPPGVGDWVWLRDPPAEDPAVIAGLLPRRTVFLRGAAGRATRPQVVAANVDLVFVVTDLDRDYNPRRVERYVAQIWASGAEPAVILNKQDLCPDPSERVVEIERRCPCVPVYPMRALEGAGLEPLLALGEGQTAALVGSSGVGKSTLVNRLLGEERVATAAVADDGRGRHTTSHRQLHRLPGGGLLLDTPGMRELSLLDEDGLDRVFDEVAAVAARCRFRDCRHEGEPGCAVAAAVAAGKLDPGRLEHLRKLEQEARSASRRQDERLRRQDERRWGHLVDEGKRQMRLKRGDWG